MEAFFRLLWLEFVRSMQTSEAGKGIGRDQITATLTSTRAAIKASSGSAHMLLEELMELLSPLWHEFQMFCQKSRQDSALFSFWHDYITMVGTFLQFIHAERSGNWSSHLNATAALAPHFFSMDRHNYARFLPVYLADMHQLHEDHPDVYEEFMNGNNPIRRSTKPFSQVWTDMALEQSINRDSKSKGGIIGISQRPGALARWFLTSHEKATITGCLKEMCGFGAFNHVENHKEAMLPRIKRDEEDIGKLLALFESEMMTNPFVFGTTEKPLPLITFATGVVAPEDISRQLVNEKAIGTTQMKLFMDQRIITNQLNFWDPRKKLNIRTFSTMVKKKQLKTAEKKVITVSADRDLFGRLIVAATARDVDLKSVFTFELSSVPFSLFHSDATMRKTDKSSLLAALEKYGEVPPPQLPSSTDDHKVA